MAKLQTTDPVLATWMRRVDAQLRRDDKFLRRALKTLFTGPYPGNWIPEEPEQRTQTIGNKWRRWVEGWFKNLYTTNIDFDGTLAVDGTIGTANQVFGTNAAATAQEHKTLAVGTVGTDFAVAHAANSITLNLPDASATARGVISLGAQTMGAGAKTFTGQVGIGGAPDTRLHVKETAVAGIAKFEGNGQGNIQFYDGAAQRGFLGFGSAGHIFTGALANSMGLRTEAAWHLGTGSTFTFTMREIGYAPGNGYIAVGGQSDPLSVFEVGGEASPELGIRSSTTGNRWTFQSNADGTLRLLNRTTSGASAFVPDVTGQDFGSTGNRWDVFGQDASLKRVKADAGTALVAGDFALSAGWGTTASIGTITGTDQRFRATITSAGTGQGANPTVVLTFKDLTWTSVPFFVVSRAGGSQPTVQFEVTTVTATALTLTWQGTPVATETYIISVVGMG